MDHRKLNRRREFSEQIRRKAVTQFRSGRYSVKELANLYHCAPQTIYRWIYKYSPADSPSINVVEMQESKEHRIEQLQQKIADLEQAVGQKQIKIDLMEKMLELAEADYDLDVKKSISGTPSSGSGATTKS